MTRPIVHIGYHKTATTWFQKVYYPSVRNYEYIPRNRVKQAFLSDTPFTFDAERARQVLEIGERHPILCEEELSGYLHNGGLAGYLSAEMAHRIKAVFPDARIVIFIRSQPAMIASTYQQYIRGGGTYSAARYLFPKQYLYGASAQNYKIPRFSLAHFEYDRLIEHYDRIFGRENVYVTLYEEFRRSPVDVLAAHAARLDIELDSLPAAEQRENRSYAPALIPIARVLNRLTYRTVADKQTAMHIPYWYMARRYLLEKLNATGIFGAPPAPERLLGKSITAYINAYYAESNRRLLRLRELPLGEHGYPIEGVAETPPVPARPGSRAWLNQ